MKRQDSRLLLFTAKLIKYFLLAIFSLAIVCIISTVFGGLDTIINLLPLVADLFGKLGIILLCLMIITMVVESLR